MKWSDVQLQSSADGTQFLECTERQLKTRTAAEPKDTVPGSERDPVRALSLSASKKPEQMNSEPDSPFYLVENFAKVANSSQPWLKATLIGVNKLNSLMNTNLTNHSGRKRMIQKEYQEVPPSLIM